MIVTMMMTTTTMEKMPKPTVSQQQWRKTMVAWVTAGNDLTESSPFLDIKVIASPV